MSVIQYACMHGPYLKEPQTPGIISAICEQPTLSVMIQSCIKPDPQKCIFSTPNVCMLQHIHVLLHELHTLAHSYAQSFTQISCHACFNFSCFTPGFLHSDLAVAVHFPS